MLSFRLRILLSALLAFCAALPAMAEDQPEHVRRASFSGRCEKERKELRLNALKVLDIREDVDLVDGPTRRDITKRVCGDSIDSAVNRQGGAQGRCETTLNEILNTIYHADKKIGEACDTISKVNANPACNQETCFREMAMQVRQAATKLDEARKLVADGAKKLAEFRENNESAAVAVANNLNEIARIIEEFNSRATQAVPAAPQLQSYSPIRQQQIINEELRKRVGPSLKTISGREVTVEQFMVNNNLTHFDAKKIKERASDISRAATAEKPTGETNYEQLYGHYAGEQIQVKQMALQYEPVATTAQRDLQERSAGMNRWATRLEMRVPGPVDQPPANRDAPPAAKPVAAAPAPVQNPAPISNRSSRMDGASRLLEAAKTGAELGAEPATKAPLARTVSTSKTPAFTPAQAAAAPGKPIRERSELAESEKTSDEPEPFGKPSPLEVATADTPPASSPNEGFTYSIPGGGPAAPTETAQRETAARKTAAASEEITGNAGFLGTLGPARAPASPEASQPLPPAAAPDEASANAYADEQLARFESAGRKFSPKLRSQLREQLKAGFSLRKLAAEGAAARARGNGTNEAVAGLISEMRKNGTLPSDQGRMRRELLSLAGAETDAEIQRLMNDLNDEDAGLGILGAQSLSLFERVKMAHVRRFR